MADTQGTRPNPEDKPGRFSPLADRRRLVKTGLAAIPAVVFTLRSHPAWGQGQVQLSTATSPYKLRRTGMSEEDVERLLEEQQHQHGEKHGEGEPESWWNDAPPGDHGHSGSH